MPNPEKAPGWFSTAGKHRGEDRLRTSEKDTTANRPSAAPLLIPDSGKQRASKCRNSDSL